MDVVVVVVVFNTCKSNSVAATRMFEESLQKKMNEPARKLQQHIDFNMPSFLGQQQEKRHAGERR